MATLATVVHASSLERKSEPLPFALGEIPRGALTEIAGPASSGRTTLLHALLAAASLNQEFCALIDAEDAFDPAGAAATGVCLSQVLWVRCGGNTEHALKAADLLAHAGGFGLVALDLADTPARIARRIPMAAWFRLRHGVEHTKTALVSVGQQINARSCSALKIELRRERTLWRGIPPAKLLRGMDVAVQRVKDHRADQQRFTFWR
jgi:recombination protein RecA